jgi:hypothetical protein
VGQIVTGRMGRLQRGGKAKEVGFTAWPAGDLEPNRHAVASQTRAQGSGGKTQKIERVCVIDLGDQGSMREAGRLVQTAVERGYRQDGGKNRIVLVKLFESVAIEGVPREHALIIVAHGL